MQSSLRKCSPTLSTTWPVLALLKLRWPPTLTRPICQCPKCRLGTPISREDCHKIQTFFYTDQQEDSHHVSFLCVFYIATMDTIMLCPSKLCMKTFALRGFLGAKATCVKRNTGPSICQGRNSNIFWGTLTKPLQNILPKCILKLPLRCAVQPVWKNSKSCPRN